MSFLDAMMQMLYTIIFLILSMIGFIFYILSKNHDYFEKRNIPFSKPHFIFGAYKDKVMKRESRFDFIIRIHNEFKNERFVGYFMFRDPVLMVLDKELIADILTKDFKHFEDRPKPIGFKNKLSDILFIAKGNSWKKMRHDLKPGFASVQLKGMMTQMLNACDKSILNISKEKGCIEILTYMSRVSNDIIASCLFGLEEPKDEVEKKRYIENLSAKSRSFTGIKYWLGKCFPEIVGFLNLSSHSQSLDDYFIEMTRMNLNYRRQNEVRKDFLQLIMELKEKEEREGTASGYTEKVIASFLFAFLSVGSESISNTLGFCLMELSRAPEEVQEKLRAEIREALDCHGGWTYEAFQNMRYLDAVIQETLRLYSVAPLLKRVVTRPWRVPDSDLVLEKGLQVIIPTAAIHRDPQHYPEPLNFLHDRFMGAEKPFHSSPTFMPFGNGPRICIAKKFAILKLRVFIAKFLNSFKLSWSDKNKTPLQMDPEGFFPRPLGGIYIKLQQIPEEN